jgi:DNA-directed RNA polymerase specialized sigma24 family protein
MLTASLADVLGHGYRLGFARPTAPSDEFLLRAVHEGDDSAFTPLLHRHGQRVLRVCRRYLRRSHDIEDAVQATLLVLARRAGQIREAGRLGNWLHGVAHRVARKMRRRLCRQTSVGLPEDVIATPVWEPESELD